MTQEERWQKRYEEVVDFIEVNKRNPSKYVAEERLMVHFLKRGRKMLNAGELSEPRFSKFLELLELSNRYKRKNQYVWEYDEGKIYSGNCGGVPDNLFRLMQ